MPVTRLNHAVLYVRDVDRTRSSTRAPSASAPSSGCRGRPPSSRPRARPTTTTSGPSRSAPRPGPAPPGAGQVGLYHLAWEVDTLAELERLAGVLTEWGSLVGASDHSTTKSLYAKDPDGIEFEVCWIVPAALLTDEVLETADGSAHAPRPPRGDRPLRRRDPRRRGHLHPHAGLAKTP